MRKFRFGTGYGGTCMSGVSLLALAAMVAAGSVSAQTAPAAGADDAGKEVVVVGVRKALKSAQQIKKNADTQVDSITATDIGAFPDKSVAEALQRVPGITVTRFAASDDSSHFSAEPSGVLVRGLTQVRTEFNGRDSFSADGARGLNFSDIAPELMAGIDSYKNQPADMIEGGIAGSINLRTRLPFDSKGQLLQFVGKANYGDISKNTTYDYSAIYANRWDTELGEFGFMADYANSHVVTATNGVIMGRIATYCSAGYSNVNGVIVNSDGSIPCTASPYGGTSWQYLPSNVTYSSNSYDRNRHGTALAAQWQNHEHTLVATLQYNDSYYHNKWTERTIEPVFHDLWAAPAFNPISSVNSAEQVAGSSALVFGSDGMLHSGTFAQHIDYWGSGDNAADPDANVYHASVAPGVPFVAGCYDWTACTPKQMGENLFTSARIFDRAEQTQDFSLQVKWDVSDNLKTNFDVQYIKAGQDSYDILLSPKTQSNIIYSTDSDGIPTIDFAKNVNNNYAAGGLGSPHNWYYAFVQDHLDHSRAKELATRADMEYRFKEDGWLHSLKAGVRYSERDQKVSYSTFNWSSMYANWGCDAAFFNTDAGPAPYNNTGCGAPNTTFNGYKPGLTEAGNFGSDFYNGHVLPASSLVFPNVARTGNQQGLINELSIAALNNQAFGQGWTPLCSRGGLVAGSCYNPGEMLDLTEKTSAAYVMLKFGGPDKTLFDTGVTVQGNVGVRYVSTEDQSTGGVTYPTSAWYTGLMGAQPCGNPLLPGQVINVACYITPALQAYSNGGSSTSQFGGKHSNVLPSFSVRFGLTDKQFIRLSGSRAMARPDIGLMRNFVQIGAPTIDTSASSPYIVWTNPSGPHTAANVAGYNFVFAGNSGNANLKPYVADQFDLSYEDYFSDTGSFTFVLFSKHLNGGIGLDKTLRPTTNNGSTIPVVIAGPANNSGGGSLRGYEVAYQRFFDFLPGLWSGLGVQANYTHVVQSGINNTNLTNFPVYDGGTGAGGGGNNFSTAVIDSHQLAGISKDSYNVVGLYEKGPFAARLAYNWRSQFLVNNLDVIIGLPVYEKAAGYLDGSLRYKINDHIEVSVEGSNLGGTVAQLQQQIFGDSSATPGAKAVFKDSSWIKNDRRYQIGIRYKY